MDRNLKTPTVQEIMTKTVFALGGDFSVQDAIKSFNDHRIASAPVINEKQEVIGFLTEGDCIQDLGQSLFYDDAKPNRIENLMNKNVYFAEEDWDIFKLEDFFISNNLRAAPVVDKENHLVGIVSRRDILRALELVLQGRNEYKTEIMKPFEFDREALIKLIHSRK